MNSPQLSCGLFENIKKAVNWDLSSVYHQACHPERSRGIYALRCHMQ